MQTRGELLLGVLYVMISVSVLCCFFLHFITEFFFSLSLVRGEDTKKKVPGASGDIFGFKTKTAFLTRPDALFLL